jgi:hypothetical protein
MAMNILPDLLLYVGVGCGEWYLALRRTLACARGERVLLVAIVFIENLLGLWVLSNFIRTNDWSLALCYSGGASLGAFLVAMRDGRAASRPLVSNGFRPAVAAQAARRAPRRLSRPRSHSRLPKRKLLSRRPATVR